MIDSKPISMKQKCIFCAIAILLYTAIFRFSIMVWFAPLVNPIGFPSIFLFGKLGIPDPSKYALIIGWIYYIFLFLWCLAVRSRKAFIGLNAVLYVSFILNVAGEFWMQRLVD